MLNLLNKIKFEKDNLNNSLESSIIYGITAGYLEYLDTNKYKDYWIGYANFQWLMLDVQEQKKYANNQDRFVSDFIGEVQEVCSKIRNKSTKLEPTVNEEIKRVPVVEKSQALNIPNTALGLFKPANNNPIQEQPFEIANLKPIDLIIDQRLVENPKSGCSIM